LSASEAGAAEKSRREKAYTEVAENTAITEKRKTLNAWIVRTWGAGVLRPYKGKRNPRTGPASGTGHYIGKREAGRQALRSSRGQSRPGGG
jgi:hypothetical protein